MVLKKKRRLTNRPAVLALLPAFLILLIVYLGTSAWSVWISLTNSRLLPNNRFIGLRQYELLFGNDRWLTSVYNLLIFGGLFLVSALVLGFLLAVAIDQRVRGENIFRSIFLYPYSMSFIVTGLVWQWLLNPTQGIEKLVRGWGFPNFAFDWIVRQETVIFCLALAAVWHAAGLVMAILLAGLRGIDEDIWRASRVEGIPAWRVYLSIVLPMLSASFVTSAVLLSAGIIRLYDLPVAMTNGGPGVASEVPAKFVMDHLFERANIGLAMAAATMMLMTVVAVVAPYLYWRAWKGRRA